MPLMSTRFSDNFPPSRGRTHEVTGAGAYAFAAIMAGALNAQGPVVWLAQSWTAEQINPIGLLPYCDPHKLLMVRAPSAVDMLAASEEALRSGAVPLVVAEITEPLTLTAGRRLQLAAKEGRATGLMIVPGGMGSNAAQTRWQADPRLAAASLGATRGDSTCWRWSLIKNKSGTLAGWDLYWNDKANRLSVAAATGERAISAPLSI